MATDAQTTLLLQINANLDGIKKAQQGFLDLQAQAKAMVPNIGKAGSDAGDGFAANFKSRLLSGIGLGAGFSIGVTLATGIANAFQKVTDSIAETVNMGVKFNATLETTQFGLAGVLKQFDPQRFGNFTDAMKGSAEVIEILKQKALQLGLSFPEIAEQYRATAGAMFKGGITDLNKQVELSIMLKRSMDAVGISGSQAVRDTADILNGIANRTMAGRMLHIDDKDLKAASEAGNLYEFLTQKLDGFNVAANAAQGTLDALERRFENTKAQVAADQTKELTAAHKELFAAMTNFAQSDTWKKTIHWFSLIQAAGLQNFAQLANFASGRGTMGPKEQMLAGNQRDYDAFKGKFDGVKSQDDIDDATASGNKALRWQQATRDSITNEWSKRSSNIEELQALLAPVNQLTDQTRQQLQMLKEQGQVMIQNNARATEAAKLAAMDADWTAKSTKAREEGVKKYEELSARERTRMLGDAKVSSPDLYSSFLSSDNAALKNRLNGPETNPDTYLVGADRSNEKTVKDGQTAAAGKRLEILGLIAANEKEIQRVREETEKKTEADNKKREAGELRLLQVKAQDGTMADRINALQVEKNALDKNAYDFGARSLEIDQKITKLKTDAVAASRAEAASAETRAQEAQINSIRENRFLSEREKRQQLYLAYKQQEATIDAKIAAAQAIVDTQPVGSATRAQAQGDVKRLTNQRDVEIPKGIDANAPLTMAQRIQQSVAQMKNGFADMASLVANGLGATLHGLSGSIDGLLMKTMNWRQAWNNLAMSVTGSVVKSFSDMAAQAILGETMKTAAAIAGAHARTGVRVAETAAHTATTTTQVAVHTGGEAAKTGATAAGALGRGVIRVAETIFEGIQVGIRVAVHVAGEIAKTAMTVLQAGLRIVVIIVTGHLKTSQAWSLQNQPL